MDILKRTTHVQDGVTVIIDHIADPDADLSYLIQDYPDDGISTHERARYQKQDADRLAAYNRGEWYMIGIAVTLRKQTATNWGDGGLEVGRASIWGIESDFDPEYFDEVARDLIAEAFAEMAELKRALGA